MTLTVHHLNNSRSLRVLFLLEELGVPYDVKLYERNAKTMLAPDELKKIHPLGKAPLVTDDGLTIAETGAIMEYLAGKFDNGTLRPAPDTEAGRRVTYYLHYAEGSLMPLLLISLIFNRLEQGAPMLVKPVVHKIVEGLHAQFLGPQTKLQLDFLESELADRPWFAGEHFTIADAQMSFPIQSAATRLKMLGSARPNLQNWLDRVLARPAYARAVEQGGV